MPYSIRKLPNQDLYRVFNTQTKVIHSYSTTLANAKKQVTLLNMVDAGVPLKKKGKGSAASIQRPTTPPIDYDEEVARAKLAKAEAEEQKAAKERDDAEEKRLKNKGKGIGASAQVRPETPPMNVVEEIEEEEDRIAELARQARIKEEIARAKAKKEEREAQAKIREAKRIETAKRRALQAEEDAKQDKLEKERKLYSKLEEAKQKYMYEFKLVENSEENEEDSIDNSRVNRAMNNYFKLRTEAGITDDKDPDFPINPNKQNEMEGAGISQTEKLKIAETIRPISKEDAVESYTELDNLKTIPPTTSRKGNEFVDYFTFLERLETKGNKGISFWEFWKDKNVYMKKQYVKNLLSYLDKGGKKDLAKDLYKVFGVYFGAPMIFKPVIAMSVYAKFKPTSVLDFTMGWGGRLVGAAALDIPNYIGIDLNKNLEKPYREMEKTLKELGTNTNIKLIFKDALKVDYSKLNYDMVFTSPPYYNVELYRGTNKMTEEEWNEKFYIPIFTKTWKYLKSGGHYILNVPSSVYENVLVKLLGKADKLIPLGNKRSIAKKLKQTEYTEYMYVWNKTGKKGGSIETDRFEEDGIVSLPKFRSVKINLPTYMYKKLPDINGKPPPYKYKLVVPITSSRNLSSRKQETSLDINQKPVSKPNVVIAESEEQPNINDFSPADKAKIEAYYAKVAENEDENPDEIDKDEYEIKPRGKPLPCRNGAAPCKDCKEKQVAKKKADAPSVKAIVANIEGKSKAKTFKLTDEQLTDLFLEDEDAFALYNNNLEEFKKKYKGKYGKKFGFGVGNPLLGKVEQKNISANSNMANKWITYVKEYASKNGMSYRDALRDPKCKAGYTKSGSGASMGMKAKVQPETSSADIPVGKTPVGRRVSASTATAVSNIKNPLTRQQRTRTKVMDVRQASQTMAAKVGRGIIDEMGGQALVAMAYNDSGLGANAGRKFISL